MNAKFEVQIITYIKHFLQVSQVGIIAYLLPQLTIYIAIWQRQKPC